ncbi:MAG TPA: hypothetical protein VFS88_04550 [Micavibrio sp.]|nr:hypothetical protein [Micavibrio sp.]
MRRYASAIVMLVVLCSLAVSGRAMIADKGEVPDLPSISPEGHQPIRASVIDSAPSHFTIDVRKFANIGADEDAPTFALYLGTRLPKRCGDFRDIDLAYWKPSKYRRVFNLSGKDKVLRAIGEYDCIVLRNAPPVG